MLITMLVVAPILGAAPTAPPNDSYLIRAVRAIELIQAEIPSMQPVADEAAARLAAGGSLWVTGQPSVMSELCGRAGGLMLAKRLGDKMPAEGDVVLYAQEAPGALPEQLTDSGALIIVFGQQEAEGARTTYLNHAEDLGISSTLANTIPGWVFCGELVAALTRLGKMPVMYASIGTYGGYPRIYQYQKEGILWHEKHDVAPVESGFIGNAYCDAVGAMLRRVEAEQRANLDKAGAWAAEAKTDGKRLIMYSMGHLFPHEVEQTAIGTLFEPAGWNSGFFQKRPPDHTYAPGDVVVHIGYQHPPYRLLERARPAGARVAYVDVMRHRDYTQDPDVTWIDPMWPWMDACVELEGYDIAMLPPSGIVNAAIAWEIYRVAAERLG